MSRVAITIVEVDIEWCGLIYGSSPCQAELPTGGIKCFNCASTCQDPPNFTPDIVTLRFIMDNGMLPKWIEAFPCLQAPSYSSAIVSLGENLGTRASITIPLKDFRHSDTGLGFDKYRTERDYDPYEQGTFWGKFRARQIYLRGQPVRYIQGFMPDVAPEENYAMGTPLPDDALDEQETRHFIVESFDGLSTEGQYLIVAKDILKLADGDRAQAPSLSNGRLSADITISATTATMLPSGIGDIEYPSYGYANIGGKEIVFFGRDYYGGKNANTEVLLHFNGTDASTTITDDSGKAHAMIAFGNAKLTTAQKRYGPSSLLLDGAGDYVYSVWNAAWRLNAGTGPFTIDAWIKVVDLAAARTIASYGAAALTNQWSFQIDTTGELRFSVISTSTTLVSVASAAAAIVPDTEYHVAVERKGNVFTLYIDGVPVANATAAITIPNYGQTLNVGISSDYSSRPFKGVIDEFRIQFEAFFDGDFSETLPGPYDTSGDILSITRGQKNTTAQAASANDRVQLVLSYVGADPAEIMHDLLVNYAGVPEEQIPLASWLLETQTYLSQVFTADIAEPVSVNKLCSEIVKQAALSVWTDERVPEVKLRVMRSVLPDATLYDDKEFLTRSPKINEQPDKRISQVWTYYAMRNALEGDEDPDNFRQAVIRYDAETEANYGSSAIEKVFSRWIPFGGRVIAESVNDIILSRFKFPPRKVGFDLFRLTEKPPALGMSCNLSHHSVQDATGARALIPLQITRVTPGDAGYQVEAEELQGGAQVLDLINRVLYIDSDERNINVKDLHDSIFQPLTDQDVIDGVTVTVNVSSDILLGSTSTLVPAIDFGDTSDWPTGLQLRLILNAGSEIRGKGGDGGDGAQYNWYNLPINQGKNGGIAVKTRVPMDIEVDLDSLIGGGGGGGGGGGAGLWGPGHYGAAGGAGAGDEPGTGGSWPNPTTTTPATLDDGGLPGVGAGYGHYGGAGGDLGQDGVAGNKNAGGVPAGAKGLAGAAIDGISFVTMIGTCTIAGPQVN